VAVGEEQNRPFQLSFNSSLKVDFQGSAVTSDGGLILVLTCAARSRSRSPVGSRVDAGLGKGVRIGCLQSQKGNSG
jgi:hypothetical protein